MLTVLDDDVAQPTPSSRRFAVGTASADDGLRGAHRRVDDVVESARLTIAGRR